MDFSTILNPGLTQIFGRQFDNHLKVSGSSVNQQPKIQWYLSGESDVAMSLIDDEVMPVYYANEVWKIPWKRRRNDVQMTHQAISRDVFVPSIIHNSAKSMKIN